MTFYNQIYSAHRANEKLLAILLDPEKLTLDALAGICEKIRQSPATHIFVGGSSYSGNHLDELIAALKAHISLPVLLFPGHPSQISAGADGILFLMLLSGRNPDYLIGHQIEAVPILEKINLEIISTGYILVESGAETAVARVSQTKPIDRDDFEFAAQTAKAGELIGNQLIYLEAGSGAQHPVPTEMIKNVARKINVPLIVGGGIRCPENIQKAYDAGADMVVIGTAFENDLNFFGP